MMEEITMEKYTIDELLDVLQWARDRAAYYRGCAGRFKTGVVARIGYGYILPWVDVNSA